MFMYQLETLKGTCLLSIAVIDTKTKAAWGLGEGRISSYCLQSVSMVNEGRTWKQELEQAMEEHCLLGWSACFFFSYHPGPPARGWPHSQWAGHTFIKEILYRSI